MDIFGIGGNELVAILLLAVIVLGPQRLVTVVRELGKLIRSIKAYLGTFSDELKNELDVLEDIKEIGKDLNRRV